MNAAIPDEDLSPLSVAFAAPLLFLRAKAYTAANSLRNAGCEGDLEAAIAEFNAIETPLRALMGRAIHTADLPFAAQALHALPDSEESRHDHSDNSNGDSGEDHDTDDEHDDDRLHVKGEKSEARSTEVGLPPGMLATAGPQDFSLQHRAYELFYAIHISRLERLVCRLRTANEEPGRRGGVQVAEEAQTQYAELLCDEMRLQREYRRAVTVLLVNGIMC
ncbi:hypothetical protein GTA08_BOTSDO12583 [Botryosphaeria dothidea]|uniref:Uncharacterized protein n=1 Tax=Botryosphaeria dothidea TaxID=55169 RepID=A0A8H4N936_9PEZI|nr:hypothetical protein GTA08_BOTSDO12583 [Botryosphaeria dothidea]